MNKLTTQYSAAITLSIAVGLVGPAIATSPESSGAAPIPAESSGLEEIIVTAQRRQEDVKEVPASISVLGGAALENGHIEDLEDITRAVPGISFLAGGGPGLDNIELRGISSTSGSATVGLYLDDVPITVSNLYNGAVQPRLFDLDRIEVLRGPQGTLFGASAMGGAIRFISNQPDLNDLSGSVNSQVSGTRRGGVNYDEQGVVNLPIIAGQSAVRIGVDFGEQSGYIDNYTLADQLAKTGTNDDRWAVLRASAKVAVDDTLVITPVLFGQWEKTGDTSVFDPSLGLYNQQKEVSEPSQDHILVGSLTINKEFAWGQLTAISSYFGQQFNRIEDGTYYNSEYLGYLADSDPPSGIQNQGYLIGQLPGPVFTWTHNSVASQEIRLASLQAADSKLSWVGGLFFSDYQVHRRFNAYVDKFDQTFQSIYGIPPQDSNVFAGSTFPSNSVGTDDTRVGEKQYAAFADMSYVPLPGLKATAGVRYSYAPTTFTDYQGGYFAGGAPPVSQGAKFYSTTPKFSLTYDATPETTLYATAAQGYRIGGSETYVPTNICANDLANLGLASAPRAFNSDSLWSYEGGVKGRFLGNTLSINADAYFVKWSNIQQTVNLPTCGFTITTNVGDAQSYGPELEVTYRPVRDLTLGLSTEYTHATLTNVRSSVGAAVGDHILNVPEWMATLRGEYSHQLVQDVKGFFRADYDWTGPSNGAFSPADPDYSRPSYSVMNASVGIAFGSFEISLFGKNIFDDTKIIQRPSLLFVEEGYTVRPLTAGVGVRMKF